MIYMFEFIPDLENCLMEKLFHIMLQHMRGTELSMLLKLNVVNYIMISSKLKFFVTSLYDISLSTKWTEI